MSLRVREWITEVGAIVGTVALMLIAAAVMRACGFPPSPLPVPVDAARETRSAWCWVDAEANGMCWQTASECDFSRPYHASLCVRVPRRR